MFNKLMEYCKQYKTPLPDTNLKVEKKAHYSVKHHFIVMPLDMLGMLMVIIKYVKF